MIVEHSRCISKSFLPWLMSSIKYPAAPWFSVQVHGSHCMLDRLQLQTAHWSSCIHKGFNLIKSVLIACMCELQSQTGVLDKMKQEAHFHPTYSAGLTDLLRLRSGHWAMNPWGMTSICTSCIIPYVWKNEKKCYFHLPKLCSIVKFVKKNIKEQIYPNPLIFLGIFLTSPCQGRRFIRQNRE